MQVDTIKIIVSFKLYRQSLPFISSIGEKERKGCTMLCYSHNLGAKKNKLNSSIQLSDGSREEAVLESDAT